ncbi:MAG: hypothetical protein WCJ70_00055 [bacterium]
MGTIVLIIVLGIVLVAVGQVNQSTVVAQVGNLLMLTGMVFGLLFLGLGIIAEYL